MNIVTVNTDRINNKPVADYLASTDRRVTIGVRFTLEALGIELPDFLCRKPAGRPGRAALMAAVDADTGTIIRTAPRSYGSARSLRASNPSIHSKEKNQ